MQSRFSQPPPGLSNRRRCHKRKQLISGRDKRRDSRTSSRRARKDRCRAPAPEGLERGGGRAGRGRSSPSACLAKVGTQMILNEIAPAFGEHGLGVTSKRTDGLMRNCEPATFIAEVLQIEMDSTSDSALYGETSG